MIINSVVGAPEMKCVQLVVWRCCYCCKDRADRPEGSAALTPVIIISYVLIRARARTHTRRILYVYACIQTRTRDNIRMSCTYFTNVCVCAHM